MRQGRLKAAGPRARAALTLACLLALWAGAGGLAGPAQAASPVPALTQPPAQTGLQVGLEGASFKDFLLFMGQAGGQSPVFREDQLPRDTVSLISRQSVSAAELQALFGLVLDSAGLVQTRRGEALYVLPSGSGPGRLAAAGETQILVERLAPGQDPAQIARLLDRLRSDAGVVTASVEARAVLIRDLAERVGRARAVLAALETAPAGSRLELVPLHRALAGLSAHKLEIYFKGLPGKPPAVLALAWSNSVLLAGDEGQLVQGRRLLAQMDEGGREAPALRAFRLRYVNPEKVAAMLREFSATEKRLEEMRVRVDAEAGAVVVLAEPDIMARVERLVEDLDQPRPRVLVEAVVAEFSASVSPLELKVAPGPGGSTAAVVNPAPGARAFALAAAGSGASFRGRPVENLDTGLDGLAALLSADPQVRVLARPRVAAPDGGEIRVSAAMPAEPSAKSDPAAGPGAPASGDRFRLVLTPRQEEGGGAVNVTVSLEDARMPGGALAVQARLSEGAVLLLVSGEGALSAAAKGDSGWTLLSPRSRTDGPGRLVIVLCARVARTPAPSRGLPAQPAGAANP